MNRKLAAAALTALVALGVGFGLGSAAGSADRPQPTRAQQAELARVQQQETDRECWLSFADQENAYKLVCSEY